MSDATIPILTQGINGFFAALSSSSGGPQGTSADEMP
jgi:hypothetical protein